ncbi:MAG: GNAT family N-acetyltransferase [Odoribacteraceae bacterium]|nr:GNAT family N-acetyltransferase [Odoribacteraceae bacterium]
MRRKIVIERATRDDEPSLLDIGVRCFGSMGVSHRQLLYQITRAKGIVLVARVNGMVVGGIVCLTHAGWKRAHVYYLAVHPDWRRRHVGRRLLKAAINYAYSEGMVAVTLEVKKDNEPAFCLYRGSGFSIQKLLLDYYFFHDAYRMRAELFPNATRMVNGYSRGRRRLYPPRATGETR